MSSEATSDVAFVRRAREAAWKPRHELEALGVAPLAADERAQLDELLGWLKQFTFTGATLRASGPDRARLEPLVDVYGPKGLSLPFADLAYHTAVALVAGLARPPAENPIIRDLISRGMLSR